MKWCRWASLNMVMNFPISWMSINCWWKNKYCGVKMRLPHYCFALLCSLHLSHHHAHMNVSSNNLCYHDLHWAGYQRLQAPGGEYNSKPQVGIPQTFWSILFHAFSYYEMGLQLRTILIHYIYVLCFSQTSGCYLHQKHVSSPWWRCSTKTWHKHSKYM